MICWHQENWRGDYWYATSALSTGSLFWVFSGCFLGVFWAFIPPVVMAAGLLMARNANVINISETNLPYAAYVMLSMMLWQTFTESLMAPITALQQTKPMLAKVNFLREALLLAKVGEVLFNFSLDLTRKCNSQVFGQIKQINCLR